MKLDRALERGALLIEHYRKNAGSYLDELELGGVILTAISKHITEIDASSKAWKRFIAALAWLVKYESETPEGKAWLADVFEPGQKLYPDKEKHWWWWMGEKGV